MRKSRRLHGLGVVAILFVFSLAAGCSHRNDFEGGTNTTSRQQQVPFHQDAANNAGSTDDGDNERALHPPKGETDLPFSATSEALPAGTLLTVRLDAPISTAASSMSRTFTARLETPVTAEGAPVWPHGATATGRLEYAHAAPKVGTGYVCLTLESIASGGKTVRLQTSNLFVKGRVEQSPETADDDDGLEHRPAIRIEKGHRLTFRLAQAVILSTGGESGSDHLRAGNR